MANISRYAKHVPAALAYLMPIGWLFMLGLILNVTNPLQSGPASILVVFVVLYLLIFTTLAAILRMIGAMWRVIKPQQSMSMRRGYYILSMISLAPVLMIALNTLGQLGALEFTLIMLLVGLGCFYVLRRTAK